MTVEKSGAAPGQLEASTSLVGEDRRWVGRISRAKKSEMELVANGGQLVNHKRET